MHNDYLRDYWSGIVGASLIASLCIAWAGMLLPAHGSALVPGSPPAVIRTMSNAALKGDRFVSIGDKRGDNALARETALAKGTPKIPTGCDLAFSKIVRYGNFVSRCIT